MSIEKMREQFEAWVLREYPNQVMGRFTDGEYQSLAVQHCCLSWQASREAMVVELPPVRPEPALTGEELKADGEASTWSMWVGEKLAKEDCRAAIEAQGLKVAP